MLIGLCERRRLASWVGFGMLVWLIAAPMAQPYRDVSAQTQDDVRVISHDETTIITWQGAVDRGPDGMPTVDGWTQESFAHLQVPTRLVPLRRSAATPPTIDVRRMHNQPWSDRISAADRQAVRQLPDSPARIVRTGTLRGQALLMVGISPVWQTDGILQVAERLEVVIRGATPFDTTRTDLLNTDQPWGTATPPPSSTTKAARCVVQVKQMGMQRITGEALRACGIDLPTLDPQTLRLVRRGDEVALDVRGLIGGRFAPTSELRFFASSPGDRWNAIDRYWLFVDGSAGLRMSRRSAGDGRAPERSTAFDVGSWRRPRVYSARQAGPDGDHWFVADLLTVPTQSAAVLSVPLTPTLPLMAGNTTIEIDGSATTTGDHTLEAAFASATQRRAWSGAGDFTQTYSFAGDPASSAHLALIPGSLPDGIAIDRVSWRRPVALRFNGKGAAFWLEEGEWRYVLRDLPPERTLYDISDQSRPVIVALAAGAESWFQAGAGSYLLAGSDTIATPDVVAHRPVALDARLNADLIYITPAALRQTLSPLVDHRRAQGHRVAVVDVEDIYAMWTWGQVSPQAIRAFLRYAAASWQRPPVAVTLIGDGTYDPLNYSGENNVTYIPPYLAMVDIDGSETACEMCFVQLDGDDPVEDPDADLLPDLQIGRLPVKSAEELQALVGKLLTYETTDRAGAWRRQMVFVADNFRDERGTVDPAGDFAAYSDHAVALQPEDIDIERVYYDPWKKTPQGQPLVDPWRITDAEQAYAVTQAALNAGAGIVSYTGHSNQWQWAANFTTPPSAHPYLLSLYDVDTLTNGTRLPVLLEMTCLTSAFHVPTSSGTTVDERLLLHPGGGVVAVWGSSGQGLAYGHGLLQQGFYEALWQTPRSPRPIGAVAAAGYWELWSQGLCCQETIRTFSILGDPSMDVNVSVYRRSLPLVAR